MFRLIKAYDQKEYLWHKFFLWQTISLVGGILIDSLVKLFLSGGADSRVVRARTSELRDAPVQYLCSAAHFSPVDPAGKVPDS